jgi:hypothetical protein
MKCGEIELEEWSPVLEIWSLEKALEEEICARFRLGEEGGLCQVKAQ